MMREGQRVQRTKGQGGLPARANTGAVAAGIIQRKRCAVSRTQPIRCPPRVHIPLKSPRVLPRIPLESRWGIWDREKPRGSPLPHHRTNGSRIRRFGRLSQHATMQTAARPPERLLSPRQRRLHPSRGAFAPWTRRMPCRRSLASNCSSLSIPSRGTVRAFGLRRCGSAYRLLRLSAWSASLASPASYLLCRLQTSPRYSASVAQRPALLPRRRRDLPW